MDVSRLLDALCIEQGFCLDPDDRDRIIADPPTTATEIADAVIRAEGLDPLELSQHIRRQVRRRVAEEFSRPRPLH